VLKVYVREVGKGVTSVAYVGGTESKNHILFDCIIARMIWGFLREIFKWNDHPTSLKSLSETWLQGMGPLPVSLTLFILQVSLGHLEQ
jgi:hypothetical protein